VFGSTSVGKSRWVRSSYPDVFSVPLPIVFGGQLWFDNYNGQRAIVLDEFRGQVPIDYIISLCDRYTIQVPTKGGFVPFSADIICFTSQTHPDNWWSDDPNCHPEDRAAFAGLLQLPSLWRLYELFQVRFR